MRENARMEIDGFIQRLDVALAQKGWSDRKASMAAGLGVDAIRMIRRKQSPRFEAALALARALDAPIAWLLAGETESPSHTLDPDSVPDGVDAEAYVAVYPIAAYAGAGGGGTIDTIEETGAPELLPRRLIESELRGTAEDFALIEIEGQSMEPVLLSGDRVLIDRRSTNPSQAGIFALWDGFGIVVKWLDRIRDGGDVPRLRVLSENARFEPYEITLDEANIIGRVVWYARRL